MKKYRYILNNEVIYETDDAREFVTYLLTNPEASQAKYSVLYNLLENIGHYTCNCSMVTKSHSDEAL